MISSISVSLAFLAGLLSFVSPCVLPLVPIYLGYLSASSLYGDASPSMNAIEIASGLLMVEGGILLITGTFTLSNSLLVRITPEWLLRYL